MILLYFSSSLHVTDEVVLPIGDGPSGQQTNLLDQSPMGPCEGHQVSVPPISSPVRSAPKTPQGPSGQQTKLLNQSPMGPCKGHPVYVAPPDQLTGSGDDNSNLVPCTIALERVATSSPVRNVSRKILQSPNVVRTPERRMSREALLRTPERTRTTSRKYLYLYDRDNVLDKLYDLDNFLDELYDLDNALDELYDLNNVLDKLYDLDNVPDNIFFI